MRKNEGEVLVCLGWWGVIYKEFSRSYSNKKSAFQGDTQKQFYNLPFLCTGLEKLL